MSNSLRPHGWEQARLPSPSLSPSLLSSGPLSWWSCLIISSSATPFSFCPQSLPGLKFFPMSPLFPPDGQSIGVSASASVLPMNNSRLISFRTDSFVVLAVKGLSRVFSNTTVWKHQFFSAQPSSWFNCHIHTWSLGKTWLWLHLCWRSDISVF